MDIFRKFKLSMDEPPSLQTDKKVAVDALEKREQSYKNEALLTKRGALKRKLAEDKKY